MKLVFHDEDESRTDLRNSLHEWLKRSDQLVRSHVELVARPGTPGEMGVVADLVMNLNVVEVTAAVSAIMAWLRFRGVDIDAEKTAGGGIKIVIRRLRRRDVRETEKLLTDLIRGAYEADRKDGNHNDADHHDADQSKEDRRQ